MPSEIFRGWKGVLKTRVNAELLAEAGVTPSPTGTPSSLQSLGFSPFALRGIEGSGGGERESWNLAGDSAGVTKPGKKLPSFLVPLHPYAPIPIGLDLVGARRSALEP